MKTTKYSRQREAILAFLQTRTDHPTADTVYSYVKEKYPHISRGTVYRNLNFLAEQGTILKLYVNDDSAHFDATTNFHCHFYCDKCAKVYDLLIPDDFYMEFLNGSNNYVSHKINGCSTIFNGICKECISN